MAPEPVAPEPVAPDPVAPDPVGPPPAIARFFDPVALEANRAGRLAPQQAARLRRTVILRIVGYLVSGALAFMLYLARAEASGTVGLVVGVLMVAVLAVAVIVFQILQPLADLRAGRAEAVSGVVRKESWLSTGGLSRGRQYQLHVGDRPFMVGHALFDAVHEDARAIAYSLPRSGDLLTLEEPPV